MSQAATAGRTPALYLGHGAPPLLEDAETAVTGFWMGLSKRSWQFD